MWFKRVKNGSNSSGYSALYSFFHFDSNAVKHEHAVEKYNNLVLSQGPFMSKNVTSYHAFFVWLVGREKVGAVFLRFSPHSSLHPLPSCFAHVVVIYGQRFLSGRNIDDLGIFVKGLDEPFSFLNSEKENPFSSGLKDSNRRFFFALLPSNPCLRQQ
ncbi:hypothetical protein NPIL_334161 [Nephila pilipes]|uniref:Uncharacterized protein n=1 Tax=Nephila pilipes TaxID=299642 RepID=A0A8X6MW81_NEPPI|nr:hypothetical protein NPIL_334161 [Nephila pilipes]